MAVTDSTQLPFLLKLFDDESAKVRGNVLTALLKFGDDLPMLVAELAPPIDAQRVSLLEDALDEHRKMIERSNLRPYQPGQLIVHRRYGYRGVIVDFTEACTADDEWYSSNKTQPERNQPWYHVLVHGSIHVTYAAHSSLKMDDSGSAVVHPWIKVFFTEFEDDHYKRNDRPFPS
jgi:heat shock protein HspQ